MRIPAGGEVQTGSSEYIKNLNEHCTKLNIVRPAFVIPSLRD